MAILASYVVDLFETGRVEEVLPAFDLAERMIVTGSAGERHVVVIGFLQTVQNVASHRTNGAASFEQFLKPESRLAWAETVKLWENKTSLADVVAFQTGATLGLPWWQFGATSALQKTY